MSQYGKQLGLFDQDDNSQRYFTKKRSWSASKHRIMLRYIQSFCFTLGGDKFYQSNILNYVDGFAGEGKYDQGIGIIDFLEHSKFWQRKQYADYIKHFSDTDGSPVIALRCARLFQDENRVNLRCFFSEAKKKNNRKLYKNCQSVMGNLDYKIYDPKPFSDCLKEIIEDLQGYPTLFFLDAFGVKGLNFSDIELICDYLNRYKGELFLLFHNIGVARHGGMSEAKSDSKNFDTYTENLTKLLGDDLWKNKWLELNNIPQEFEKWALSYFESQILSKTSIEGVKSFAIKESYDDSRPLYYIVVCSNCPEKAFGQYLNDFVAEENRLLFFKESEQNKNIQKFLNDQWERQLNSRKTKIKEKLPKILAQICFRWTPLEEVVIQIILQFEELGYLKIKDYKQIIKELYKENKIEATKLGKKGQLIDKSEIKIV